MQKKHIHIGPILGHTHSYPAFLRSNGNNTICMHAHHFTFSVTAFNKVHESHVHCSFNLQYIHFPCLTPSPETEVIAHIINITPIVIYFIPYVF